MTYADTTGYTTWAKRGATSHEDISAYNSKMYSEFWRYEAETGFAVKYLSDGLVAFKEMNKGHNCVAALEVLKAAWNLQKRMNELIASMNFPKPSGFRVRVACGMVSKMWVPPTKKDGKCFKVEYVGFGPSLGDRILKIERDVPCICTETVRQLLKPGENGFTFANVIPKGPTPNGVDDDDMKELLSFKYKGDKCQIS